MKEPNITLIEDSVIIKENKEDINTTEAGVYLPEKSRKDYLTGTVIIVGDDVKEVSVGDSVIFHKSVARRTTVMGDKLIILKEEQIFFKLLK